MPPLFRDLVSALIAGHGKLDVIAKLDNRDAIGQRLQALAPQLVLIGLGGGEADDIASAVLGFVPDAKVIAFSSDSRHAFVHQLHQPRKALLDISSQQLIDAVLGF
jgi:DNA-binding NarL/FixJ family response regulator